MMRAANGMVVTFEDTVTIRRVINMFAEWFGYDRETAGETNDLWGDGCIVPTAA